MRCATLITIMKNQSSGFPTTRSGNTSFNLPTPLTPQIFKDSKKTATTRLARTSSPGSLSATVGAPYRHQQRYHSVHQTISTAWTFTNSDRYPSPVIPIACWFIIHSIYSFSRRWKCSARFNHLLQFCYLAEKWVHITKIAIGTLISIPQQTNGAIISD